MMWSSMLTMIMSSMFIACSPLADTTVKFLLLGAVRATHHRQEPYTDSPVRSER
jgi:hypothetical protein